MEEGCVKNSEKLPTLFMDGPFSKAQQRRRPNPALTAAAVCARAVCTVL